jgi:hypothetical protein
MIFVAIKQPRFSLSMGLLWLFLGIDDVQKKKSQHGKNCIWLLK